MAEVAFGNSCEAIRYLGNPNNILPIIPFFRDENDEHVSFRDPV